MIGRNISEFPLHHWQIATILLLWREPACIWSMFAKNTRTFAHFLRLLSGRLFLEVTPGGRTHPKQDHLFPSTSPDILRG